jgi:hypothetical protein
MPFVGGKFVPGSFMGGDAHATFLGWEVRAGELHGQGCPCHVSCVGSACPGASWAGMPMPRFLGGKCVPRSFMGRDAHATFPGWEVRAGELHGQGCPCHVSWVGSACRGASWAGMPMPRFLGGKCVPGASWTACPCDVLPFDDRCRSLRILDDRCPQGLASSFLNFCTFGATTSRQ